MSLNRKWVPIGCCVVIVSVASMYKLWGYTTSYSPLGAYTIEKVISESKLWGDRNQGNSSGHSSLRTDTREKDITDMKDNMQAMRLDRLKAYCQLMNLTGNNRDIETYTQKHKNVLRKSIALVDNKHEVIIFALPKTGCSTWRLTFLNNSVTGSFKVNRHTDEDVHITSFVRKYGLRHLGFYNNSLALSKFHNFLTILTVRHPFDRIESAYVDKFTENKSPPNIKKMHIGKILRYRGQKPVNGNPKNVQFEEFLRYLVDYPLSDVHWRSVWDEAHPCILNFKYIAKQETMDLDLSYITDRYLSGKHTFTKLKSWRQKERETHGKLLPLFSKLSDPEKWMQKLVQFDHDMKMFGYSYKIVDGKVYATCENYTDSMLCI